MNSKVGKYGAARPKQDLVGNAIYHSEPLHRRHDIGDGYYVELPLFASREVIDKEIDKLKKELKINLKPVKSTKAVKEL